MYLTEINAKSYLSFGVNTIREDQLDQAPLSKLTHDIDWEIDDLNECNYLRPMIGTKSEADF